MKALFNFSLALVLLVGAFISYRYYVFTVVSASHQPNPIVIEVVPGDRVHSVMGKLDAAGFRIDPLLRKLWVRQHSVDKHLQIGEFEIQGNWSARQILTHIFFGTPLLRSVTVKEGANLYDIEAAFKIKQITGTETQFHAWMHKPELLKRMGVPASATGAARTLEGFLFPETYTYFKSDSGEKIVEAMLTQWEQKVLPILEKHPLGKTPEGRFELLTLASVVEKESGNFAEQPIVASVFWNRLKKKMRLESDPTIIYGMLPKFDGNIRRGDIHAPSLWNTYVIKSLPAGPISNPGLSAIKAVVDPAITDYLFFVAKGGGEHVFSKTYAEHAQNVQRYQLKHAGN